MEYLDFAPRDRLVAGTFHLVRSALRFGLSPTGRRWLGFVSGGDYCGVSLAKQQYSLGACSSATKAVRKTSPPHPRSRIHSSPMEVGLSGGSSFVAVSIPNRDLGNLQPTTRAKTPDSIAPKVAI